MVVNWATSRRLESEDAMIAAIREKSGTSNEAAPTWAADAGAGASGLAEVAAASALWVTAALVVAATAAVTEAERQGSSAPRDLALGLERGLVYTTLPFEFAVIAIAGIVAGRAWDLSTGRRGRSTVVAAAAAAGALSLVRAAPAVVDRNRSAARWINGLPAVGVLLMLGLVAWTWRAGGLGRLTPGGRDDRRRLALGAALTMLSLPWILAAAGIYSGDLPVLERIFLSKQIDERTGEIAVHLGAHHGLNGALLALSALILGRAMPSLRHARLRLALDRYLALMLIYGIACAISDTWNEQVVKRGWSRRVVPPLSTARLASEFAVVVIAALGVVWVVLSRRRR